ncbi:hypothetical protein niasHT_024835 [Heterodera trifolii]|uniref:ATP-dependent RNA helicase Ski2/MTR4 C-terminal domain-containing protein n=1 Tax=Heterodera trifolii TaxID=157864 RepID=A0ABD2JWA7_9BILA
MTKRMANFSPPTDNTIPKKFLSDLDQLQIPKEIDTDNSIPDYAKLLIKQLHSLLSTASTLIHYQVVVVDAVEEERRLRTVVVTNVPECKSDKATERAQEDRAIVGQILNATDVDQAPIVFRVGKRMDGRPRPLKMEFPSKHAARHVIRMRGKVQALNGLHNVRVRESMTKEQLSERRKLIEECGKKRQADNGDWELLITELILDNKFEQRSAAQTAAMLSSITCQFEAKNQNNAYGSGGGGGGGRFQRDNAPTAVAAAALADHQQQQQQNERVPERMDKALLRGYQKKKIGAVKGLEHDVIAAANRIDAVQRQYGVANSPVVDELKFGLMEVVHQWATGMEFADIMRLTDAQEGIIVRCIQRLDEVCKDVRKAARIVGDPALFEKMGETSAAIRRDIVFAASLYTTEEE